MNPTVKNDYIEGRCANTAVHSIWSLDERLQRIFITAAIKFYEDIRHKKFVKYENMPEKIATGQYKYND